MNKNYKVITINGIRGIIAIIFIVFGLISGFVISPGWACMKIFNYFSSASDLNILMNVYQGILLWVVIALSLYALNNRRTLIGFNSFQGLSPEQIRDIMERTRDAEMKMIKSIEIRQKELQNAKADKENVSNPEKIEEVEEMRK